MLWATLIEHSGFIEEENKREDMMLEGRGGVGLGKLEGGGARPYDHYHICCMYAENSH